MPAEVPNGPEGSVEGMCLRCGQVLGTYSEREPLIEVVLDHFTGSHWGSDYRGGILLEAPGPDMPGDFAIYPAPWRCDLCGEIAERPWWVYTTPQSVDFPVEDQQWLVCDVCDELIKARSVIKVFNRLVRINESVFGVSPAISRQEAFPALQKFFTHYDPRLTRREAS